MKKYLYILIIGILVTFLVHRIYNEQSSINQAEIVKCNIHYIRCQIGTKGSRSLIKVEYNETIYPVPITKSLCKELKIGDLIELLYLTKNDKIVYDEKIISNKLKQNINE